MAEFYIDKKTDAAGDHLVHLSTCASLPAKENLLYLGAYSNAKATLNMAMDRYRQVSTCPKCLPA